MRATSRTFCSFTADGRRRAPTQYFGPWERDKGARTRQGLGGTFFQIACVLGGIKYAWTYFTTEHEGAPFIRKVRVLPYGVLGTQQSSSSVAMLTVAPLPDKSHAVVDPTNTTMIEKGPANASGASAGLYRWMGVNEAKQYPESVRKSLHAAGDAKLFVYPPDEKNIIHVASPDFQHGHWTRPEAVRVLARAYRNIFHEFAVSECHTLRVNPVGASSSGP
eukprot:PhF_6_TR8628/c0_g1_i1/m.13467